MKHRMLLEKEVDAFLLNSCKFVSLGPNRFLLPSFLTMTVWIIDPFLGAAERRAGPKAADL